MKKKTLILLAAASLMLGGCGTTGQQVLTDVLNTAVNGGTLDNVIASVIGGTNTTMTKKDLVGSWTYSSPGCAFTSENLLAKAGGEIAASEVKGKLLPYYEKAGIKTSNTTIAFKEDGTFAALVAGKNFSGNYTFDEKTQKITLQGLLLNINCYAKKNTTGMAILFEGTKLLTMLQAMSASSGNAQVKGIGDIAKSYDGLRVGFDFK